MRLTFCSTSLSSRLVTLDPLEVSILQGGAPAAAALLLALALLAEDTAQAFSSALESRTSPRLVARGRSTVRRGVNLLE